MALSPYTFRGALAVLDLDNRSRTVLERVFGTALFAGAGAAAVAGGPIAGLTAAAWLSLADPKNEAVGLLDAMVGEVSKRLRGTKGKDQLELIAAAHTITTVSSFFDALPETIGRAHRDLKLTDRERHRLSNLTDLTGSARSAADDLFDAKVPMSSPELGIDANLEHNLRPYYERLATRCLDFFTGLEAWKEPAPHDALSKAIVDRSVRLYRGRMLELGKSAPFSLWVLLNEHAATRDLIHTQTSALGDLRTLLTMALPGTRPGRNSYREQLELVAREVLDEPLLRTRNPAVASPTVRDGFVEPSFHYAVANDHSQPTDEDWWSNQPEHSSLVEYLASYLASPEGAGLPLLLLGHPGAGKSLLTEVLAAQLPADSFAVVRIPLRSVNPDDELTIQINKELQRTLQRPNADLEDLRQECDCKSCADVTCTHRCRLVVLLDGFDELVQATGVTQSAYLSKVEAFQKRAQSLGKPTAVIVTSRTVVADRAEIAPGTPMIKLREFDRPRIERWLDAWNAAHQGIADFVPLDADEMTDSDDISELTCQPLLLLMLAVYLAELGTNQLSGANLTQSELYQRIMDRFITRQITEKSAPDQSAAHQAVLQRRQRRQLQYAAFGMFNRGRQHITDAELNADLNALDDTATGSPALQPLTSADRVLGEFMFVHNPRADREQRSAYEFLHATFGEFLVAELILDLLVRLMRHHELEATDLNPQPTGLDDTLLRRLLSHQPISTRLPIRLFVTELANRLPAEQQQPLRNTISELLRRELPRPDTGDPLYHPLPYDPVRRRACYTANLTILRVSLDTEPVPVLRLVDPEAADPWRSLVRLWRAGLDTAAWATIIGLLDVRYPAEQPPWWELQLQLRTEPAQTLAFGEAELLGERQREAMLRVGYLAAGIGTGRWRAADVGAIEQIAAIDILSSARPQSDQVLPYDYEWYNNLRTTLADQPTINHNVKRTLLVLLANRASRVPADVVAELLAHTLRSPSAGASREIELAGIATSHPSLLDDVPGLREHIVAVDANVAPAVVAALWLAEGRADGPDRDQLRQLRLDVDARFASRPLTSCLSSHFPPDFVTYLRVEQPPHWTRQRPVPQIFAGLNKPVLAVIAPLDALYVAEIWREYAGEFVHGYLRARDVHWGAGTDLYQLLRQLAEAEGTLSGLSWSLPTDP
ncbi:hypothetical protein PWY87_31335 [Kribbella solani]|uniref:NACHT domain-containing protein n=1 Tax=Kribbella solani TaxID=236067 RepID=UPI0029A2D369|nr:hypothetical protein [Kribbella solani]MDX3006212.1 hypothetical protein [Kribbella solani]